MRQFGIDPKLLTEEDARIPYRQMVYLLEETATQLRRPDFGLLLGKQQDISILGALAVAMQNSRTVEEAQFCAAQYVHIQSPALNFNINIGPRETRLELTITLHNMSHEAMVQTEDLGIAVTHGQVKLLAGPTYDLLNVELPHPPLCAKGVYGRFFGAPVTFDAQHNALTVATRTLKSSLGENSSLLRKLAASYLDAQTSSSNASFTSRIEAAIRRSLGTDSCNRDSIGAALAVHSRTLQRRLAEEGESFNGLLDRVRRERAQYYLCNTVMPLSQIAALLGYSEQSILSHSCRRWFDANASEMRKNSTLSGS
jgi:AraC-like DNA-binding protein